MTLNNQDELIEVRDKKVNKRRVINAQTILCSAATISALAAAGLGHYNMVSSINTVNDLALFGGGLLTTVFLTGLITSIIKHHKTTKTIKKLNTQIKNNIMQTYDEKELEQSKDYSRPQDYKPYANYLKLLNNRKEILIEMQAKLKDAKVLTKTENRNIESEIAIIDNTTARYEKYPLKLIIRNVMQNR